MAIRFLQDCLLVDNKILVIGDLHLGYEEAIPGFQVREIIDKLEKVFVLLEDEGIKIEKVVLLGDIKHDFANISDEEWRDSLKFLDYLSSKISSEKKIEKIVNLIQDKKGQTSIVNVKTDKLEGSEISSKNKDINNTVNPMINKANQASKSSIGFTNLTINKNKDKIIVLKGNHDTKLNPILRKRGIELRDKYAYENICFLHGNQGNKLNLVFEQLFKQCLDSEILVVGHLHPAISISDGYKREKYKCFLKGKYKKKKIIILPSFNETGIGFDLRNSEDKILKNFEVVVYDSKENKALNFGKLKKLE